MKRLLAVLFSLAAFALVLEAGLRLLGLGPSPRINRFHPRLGWEKTPGRTSHKKTSEFDVTFAINAKGLRGSDLPYEKAPGTTRIVFAGDSFCLGYTVEERDLFLEILGCRLRAEGRRVEIVNGGTEGYSTDQEALWFREEGVKYGPDLALLCFFPNDVFWCGEERYLRYAKPRLSPEGEAVNVPLPNAGEGSWLARHTALGKMLASPLPPTFRPAPASRPMPKEFGVFLNGEPDFIEAAWKKVAAAVHLFAGSARGAGAKPLALAIPDKTAVHADARERFASGFGLPPASFDPHLPSRRFLGICEYAGVPALDPVESLRAEAARGTRLYFEKDWHLTPAGNRILAAYLYTQLLPLLPAPSHASAAAAVAEAPSARIPTWILVLVAIWAALSVGYAVSYRDEPAWLAPVKALLFVALVSGIFWAARRYAPGWLAGIAILALVGFVVTKSAGRLGTMAELLAVFARRGHWYMLPLLAVMVSIGTLLVVAASSPFVAPFIYTLF